MTSLLTNIRVGRHPTFDRVVLDMTGPEPAANHRFVDELIADGSGDIVWLTGCEFLDVQVQDSAAHDDAGTSTYPGPDKFRTRGLSNVMAVAITGDFEGILSIGIGMRRQTNTRLFTLSGPTRLVIDIDA